MSSTSLYTFFSALDTFFWGYIAFAMIIILGCYLLIYSRFFQLRILPSTFNTFFKFIAESSKSKALNTENSYNSKISGTHPIKVFFASIGGMIGIGNIVAIVTALQLGGPGALLWIWIAAFIGSLIKYSEVYLGLKYRVKNQNHSYDGGPMYFLTRAFKGKWIPIFVSVLLCIYGAEVYQFNIVLDSFSTNWGIQRLITGSVLLILVLYAGFGGISRVAKICTWLMPLFLSTYIAMSLWVISQHYELIPSMLKTIFYSAFTGHAAIGGFAGSTVLLAVQNGLSGACYCADIGIGYDSIIQSESQTIHPERQARMAILGVLTDNFICTLSVILVLITGTWHSEMQLEGTILVQAVMEQYFPYMNIVMPVFVFILCYTTLISYFSVGIKCARFINSKKGPIIYYIYTSFVLILFSFLEQSIARLSMQIAGAMLLIINLAGIFRLRKEICFSHDKQEQEIFKVKA